MPELSRVKEEKVKGSWEFRYLIGFVPGIILIYKSVLQVKRIHGTSWRSPMGEWMAVEGLGIIDPFEKSDQSYFFF